MDHEIGDQGGTEVVSRSVQNRQRFFFWNAISNSIGFTLAAYGPVLVDPKLSSHTAFGSRYYENAWLLIPFAAFVVCLSMLGVWRRAAQKVPPMAGVLPLVIGLIAAQSVFPDEVPHLSLVSVGTIWSLITLLNAWLKFGSLLPHPDAVLDIDATMLGNYIQNLQDFWKTLFIGLVLGIVAMIVAATNAMLSYTSSIVTEPDQQFFLNSKVLVEMAAYAAFVFVGPIREALSQYRRTIDLFLSARRTKENGPVSHGNG